MQRKVWLGLLSGNVIEYYDYVLYGLMAPVLSHLFFPLESRFSSLAATFAVFATGMLVRPLGGVLFGLLGDWVSRRYVLMACSLTTGLATLLIGCLPTTESIGVSATLFLILLRLLQGLGMSSEFCSVLVISGEIAPPQKRGFFSSLAHGSGMLGTLLASGISFLVFSLPQEQLQSWGWRVPFWLGGLICLNAYFLRFQLPELPGTGKKCFCKKELHINRFSFLRMFLIVAMNTLLYHLIFIFQSTKMIEQLHLPAGPTMICNTVNLILLVLCCALGGWLADKLGHRKTYLTSLLLVAASAVPISIMLNTPSIFLCAAGQSLGALVTGILFGSSSPLFSEIWPRSLRMTGTNIPYNLAITCFGGTAPLIALYLVEWTNLQWAMGLYVLIVSLLCLITVWTMQDRTARTLATPL